MLRHATLLLVAALAASACKSNNSTEKAFELGADEISPQQLIVATVIKNYPDTANYQATLVQFARAIQTDRGVGAQSPDELQQLYYAKRGLKKDKETDFDRYVVQEFVALTNYLAFKVRPGTPLVYVGRGKHG